MKIAVRKLERIETTAVAVGCAAVLTADHGLDPGRHELSPRGSTAEEQP